MLVKNKKNIFKIAIILLFCFFITACTAEDVKNKLEWLDQKAGESLEVIQQDQINKAINIMEETGEQATTTLQAIDLSAEQKEQIDQWLEENSLNRYGDAEDTIYAGGTPLFDEATGENIDRYDYILNNHSELINILN